MSISAPFGRSLQLTLQAFSYLSKGVYGNKHLKFMFSKASAFLPPPMDSFSHFVMTCSLSHVFRCPQLSSTPDHPAWDLVQVRKWDCLVTSSTVWSAAKTYIIWCWSLSCLFLSTFLFLPSFQKNYSMGNFCCVQLINNQTCIECLPYEKYSASSMGKSEKEKWVSLPSETELSSKGDKIGLVSMYT